MYGTMYIYSRPLDYSLKRKVYFNYFIRVESLNFASSIKIF